MIRTQSKPKNHACQVAQMILKQSFKGDIKKHEK